MLWTDAKYFHASQVEAGIQKHFTHQEKIGYPRMHKGGQLWKVCGAGGTGMYKKWDADIKDPKTVKVFVTYSDAVPRLLASGSIICEK